MKYKVDGKYWMPRAVFSICQGRGFKGSEWTIRKRLKDGEDTFEQLSRPAGQPAVPLPEPEPGPPKLRKKGQNLERRYLIDRLR